MKVLLVSARPPWPPWRGDQLRLRQWIEALAGHHEVDLLCPPLADDATPLPPGTRILGWPPASAAARLPGITTSWLRGLPAQVALFRSRELAKSVHRESRTHDRTIVLLARLAPLLDETPAETTILDLVDCLSLNFERRARYGPAWQRPLWRLEARRLERAEVRALSRCARAVVVSPRDREALQTLTEAPPIEVIPVAFTGDAARPFATPADDRPLRVAFTGNLGYWVNRDAIRWWGREVWPRLRERRPELEWLVAGARPAASLVRFLRRCGARLVTNPADVRRELRHCRVAVAPLRGGAGQPLKVLDAWATGTPIVVSPWTAEGLGDGGGVVVASSPAEWVQRLEELLDSPSRCATLAQEGASRLARELSAPVVFRRLRDLVELGS